MTGIGGSRMSTIASSVLVARPQMGELEPIENAPVCPNCKKTKRRLKRLTQNKNEPIWVCAEKPAKGKMPCDGHLFEIAEANGLA